MEVSYFPQCWQSTSIGEICILFNGRAFKQTEWSRSGLPIIRIQNLNNPNATFNFFDGELEAKHLIRNGDLLFAWSGTPGTSFGTHEWKGEEAALNQHIFKITFPETRIDKSYLRYAIDQKLDEFIGAANGGVGLRHITKGTFENGKIFFPPLAEQRVIADKLNNLLAQVETTKARLDRIPNILKRFRQSVLSAAVSGNLTERWRENTGTRLEGWLSTDIGELAEVATGKTPKRTNSAYWENGTVPWLTSSTTGKPYTDIAEQFVTELAVKESTLKVFPIGTLLLAMYGEGKTRGQVTEMKISATCNQACAAILVNSKKASKDFIKIRLQENYEETRKAAEGGAQPNLNLSKVRNILVSLPPAEEQAEIVRRVEELFSFADHIEQKATTALERVNNLTQSILAKAFRGELTADWCAANPDLISGENSAEALLEKIKAEREALKSRPPKRTVVKKHVGKRMSKEIITVVEALKEAERPLSGQQLLAASGYPSDSSTEQLEQFFLDIRDSLVIKKSIVKLERDGDEQDWFSLPDTAVHE